MVKKIIIGITGLTGAGKDTVANYPVKHGFVYSSLSDCIRDECAKKNIYMNRDNLILVGNQMRAEHGIDIMAKRALKKIENSISKKFVLVSIRNLHELNYLKRLGGLIMIAVTAPIEMRYRRNAKRGRTEDAVTFEEFKAQEERERSGGEKEQQLDKVIDQADLIIDNSSCIEETLHQVDNILNKIIE